jgi:hypothetical protein
MGKKIYWVLVGIVVLLSLTTVIYYAIQPQPVPKINLSQFASPTVLANSVLLRMREEIHQSPVIFLGVEAEHPENLEVWKAFLQNNQEVGFRYDLVVMDQDLPTALFPEAEKISTKEQMANFSGNIQNAINAGKRVAVIVPVIYSSQLIHGNLVNVYRFESKQEPVSFSLVSFPRRRELEKEMITPCMTDVVDETVEGALGCFIAQTARANYRKRYSPHTHVGMVEQVGMKDYLVLYTEETE